MLEEIRAYCLSKAFVTESFPFDETTLVFKVHNKMFALFGLADEPLRISLKCNPEKVMELREAYAQVLPGYHLNKKHWNTVVLEDLPLSLIHQWIDDSYQLVWNSLPKKLKNPTQ